jgi:hypothetical protein
MVAGVRIVDKLGGQRTDNHAKQTRQQASQLRRKLLAQGGE